MMTITRNVLHVSGSIAVMTTGKRFESLIFGHYYRLLVYDICVKYFAFIFEFVLETGVLCVLVFLW